MSDSNQVLNVRTSAAKKALRKIFQQWISEALTSPWPKSSRRVHSIRGHRFLEKGGVYRFLPGVDAFAPNGANDDGENMLLLQQPAWVMSACSSRDLLDRLVHMGVYFTPGGVRFDYSFWTIGTVNFHHLSSFPHEPGRYINITHKLGLCFNTKHNVLQYGGAETPRSRPPVGRAYDRGKIVDLSRFGFVRRSDGVCVHQNPPDETDPMVKKLKEYVQWGALQGRKYYQIKTLVDGRIHRLHLHADVDPAKIFRRIL